MNTEGLPIGDKIAFAAEKLFKKYPYNGTHDVECALAHGIEVGLIAAIRHPEWAQLFGVDVF